MSNWHIRQFFCWFFVPSTNEKSLDKGAIGFTQTAAEIGGILPKKSKNKSCGYRLFLDFRRDYPCFL
jgi:hypothetical protein